MISNFFVLSPRGDTILAKQYRTHGDMGAHERSHTEALFRKIKFWDDNQQQDEAIHDGEDGGTTHHANSNNSSTTKEITRMGDAPPVMLMPDGLTYFHVKRNGLLFGASTARNVSPNTVIEVS
jgi:AP-4 complex subunit mu-1